MAIANSLAAPLLYHELRAEPSSYSYVLPTARFGEQLALFAGLDPGAYRPVLTFDDGHRSAFTEALPLLERFGVQAHFFITAGWTGTRNGFLNAAEIRAMHAAGHTIGAHGWSHKLLTQCSAAELRRELNDARSALQDILGSPVDSLSLPGGRANDAVFASIREAGYQRIWTSVPGSTMWPPAERIGRFNIRAGITDHDLLLLLDPETGELERAGRTQRWKMRAQGVLGDRLYAKLWAVLNRSEGDPEHKGAA